MLEKEAQARFLLVFYLLLKENPNGRFYDQDVAEHAKLSDDMIRIKQSILPQLEKKGFIKKMGFGSRIPLKLTPEGREEAEKIYSDRKYQQDIQEDG